MGWVRRGRVGLLALLLAAIALAAAAMASRAHDARDRVMRADPETILDDPGLARTALAIGQRGFAAHCAACHATGAGDPARGVPDLTDGDYLYGEGHVAEIEQIVLHGVRSGDPRGWQLASMPAYATLTPYRGEPIPPMTPGQIRDVTQFLMLKHGAATDAAAATRGGQLFEGSGGCYDCHGKDGGGDTAIGAPNLLDDVWLYGDGSPASIERTLAAGRAGVSPAFARTISASDARAIAVYVASLSRHPGKVAARD